MAVLQEQTRVLAEIIIIAGRRGLMENKRNIPSVASVESKH
jgi:hypothetical protein